MDNGYIAPELNERLNKIVQYCFNINRMYDAGGSVLGIKFVMDNYLKNFHHEVFHAFPIMADLVSDIQANYNVITTYLPTMQGKNDYNSPLEFFQEVLDYMLEVQKYTRETVEYALITADNDPTATSYVVAKALDKFSKLLSRFIGQAILLRDKAEMYGNDSFHIQMLDADIDKWRSFTVDDLPENLLE